MTKHSSSPKSTSSPDPVDFRSRGIHYRALSLAVAGLVALIVLAVVINGLLFAYFQNREARRQPPASPFEAAERALPSPMLAVDPSEERIRMEAEMEDLLGSYDWVDPDAGRVRIPIERAMEVLAESGGTLPDGGQ